VSTPTIELSEEAPPIARGIGAALKRAAAMPKLAQRLSKMHGVVSLRSSVDHQTATVRFDRGSIGLSGGVAKDADVVITLDFNDPTAKPKVKGALRHPLLALGAAKVLDPPKGSWRDEVEAFWNFACDTPRMPPSLRVVCTDDGSDAHFGEPGQPAYEIHGSASQLVSSFSGSSVFLEDMLAGKLYIIGSFEHASILGGRLIAWSMGEGR
jgi:hypothetical protein